MTIIKPILPNTLLKIGLSNFVQNSVVIKDTNNAKNTTTTNVLSKIAIGFKFWLFRNQKIVNTNEVIV